MNLWKSYWLLALVRKLETTQSKEKLFDLSRNQTHILWILLSIALQTELQSKPAKRSRRKRTNSFILRKLIPFVDSIIHSYNEKSNIQI